MKNLIRRAIPVVGLLGLWLLLWGRITPGNLVGGVLVIAFILWIAPSGPKVEVPSDHGRLHPLAATVFALYFLKELVIATWQVAVFVVVPDRVCSGVIRVQLDINSIRIATVIANAVTLTPGTLAIDDEVTDAGIVLYVHALDSTDPQAIRRGVKQFERLAVRSFGSKSDRDALNSRSAQ